MKPTHIHLCVIAWLASEMISKSPFTGRALFASNAVRSVCVCSLGRRCLYGRRDAGKEFELLKQIRKMLCGFKNATEKVGLRIHPDKTKILSNQSQLGHKKAY